MTRRNTVIVGVALIAGGLGAQSQAPVFEATVLEVSMRFAAADPSGAAVKDLSPEELEVLEDGVPQEVTALRYEPSGLSVVLVIDSSESMQYAMEDAIGAAEDFVGLVSPDDEVMAIDFDSEVRALGGWGEPRADLKQHLRSMEADGATLLYDAMAEANELLERRQGRRAMVILSDGEDGSFEGGSRARVDDVLERAQRAEIEIHTVGVGLAVNKWELKELAEQTGGTYAFVEESAALRKIYRQIPRDLTDGYTVVYRSTNPQHDGEFRKVEIRALRDGVEVRARSGYFAPGGDR